MTVLIQLEHEQIDRFVFSDLQDTRNCFMRDLEDDCPGVFDMNPVYDKSIILKHIEALDLILDWYRQP